jgi:hypothetical protein
MRAMIFLVLVLHPITTTNARNRKLNFFILHNYSVFIKLSLSIKYCALSAIASFTPRPSRTWIKSLSSILFFISLALKPFSFLIKLLFYYQCSLMLASEPKYPEWDLFHNTFTQSNRNFRLLLFKYTLILFVLSVSLSCVSIKSTLAFIKSFWSNSEENRIGWFIFIKVLCPCITLKHPILYPYSLT